MLSRTTRKYIFRGIMYTALIFVGPFIWLHNVYTRRKSSLKYNSIVDGFANHVFPNPAIEDLAKTRASICSRCPHAMQSATMKKVIVDNKTKSIQGMYCNICGCSLSAKVRANDSCPKGRW